MHRVDELVVSLGDFIFHAGRNIDSTVQAR